MLPTFAHFLGPRAAVLGSSRTAQPGEWRHHTVALFISCTATVCAGRPPRRTRLMRLVAKSVTCIVPRQFWTMLQCKPGKLRRTQAEITGTPVNEVSSLRINIPPWNLLQGYGNVVATLLAVTKPLNIITFTAGKTDSLQLHPMRKYVASIRMLKNTRIREI